jgi:hypothetical protein
VEPVFELGTIELEEHVEHVLRGVGLAEREVGLEKIEAGGRTVDLRVIARSDQLDDLGNMPGRAEIAGDRDEDIGAFPGRGENLLINGQSAGEIFGLESLTGGGEAREDVAGGGRRFGGR